jgi:hypothetical protein
MGAMAASQRIEVVGPMVRQEVTVSMDLVEGTLVQEEKWGAQEDQEEMSFRTALLLALCNSEENMLKQQVMAGGQKDVGLAAWKRLVLIVGMFLPVGSLIALAPGQTVYAQTGWSQPPFICRAGRGGNGGIADNESSGGNGATGGDCVNGPRGGDGSQGGQNYSPGGQGGNVFY